MQFELLPVHPVPYQNNISECAVSASVMIHRASEYRGKPYRGTKGNSSGRSIPFREVTVYSLFVTPFSLHSLYSNCQNKECLSPYLLSRRYLPVHSPFSTPPILPKIKLANNKGVQDGLRCIAIAAVWSSRL